MKDLLQIIILELVETNKSLTSPLLKTKILATKIENTELLNWVNNELNGYKIEMDEKNERVPEYRKTGANLLGNYYQLVNYSTKQLFTDIPLPTEGFDVDFKKALTSITLYESVTSLEITASKSSNTIGIIFTSEVSHIIQNKLKQLNPYIELITAKKEAPAAFITQALTSIRSKLLDFMLALEVKFGDSLDYNLLKQNKQQVTTIMNQTIINNSGSIGNHNVLGNDNSSTNDIQISKDYTERQILIEKSAEIIKYLKDNKEIGLVIQNEMLAGFEVIFNELQKPEPNKFSITKVLDSAKKYGETVIFGHELSQAIVFFSKLLSSTPQ